MEKTKESHTERTSHEPRDPSLNLVILKRVDQINSSVRLFRLEIPNHGTVKFLPGQWLDVYVPTVPKAGGFTITSPPSRAIPDSHNNHDSPGYLELAIQKSPDNPPAAWLWQSPPSTILNAEIRVRVGGSFIWPPPDVPPTTLKRVVFVAAGVGVNPLMSMLSTLAEAGTHGSNDSGIEVHMLYSLRDPGPGRRVSEEMLFVERIANIFAREKVRGRFEMYLTGGKGGGDQDGKEDDETYIACNEVELPFKRRRISVDDVKVAIGDGKDSAVVYVCGPPAMTDAFVEELTSERIGMDPRRVLCEKWW